jgi:hypothetical protein
MNPAGSLNCFQSPAQSLILKLFQKPETQGFIISEDFQKPRIGSFSILNFFEN